MLKTATATKNKKRDLTKALRKNTEDAAKLLNERLDINIFVDFVCDTANYCYTFESCFYSELIARGHHKIIDKRIEALLDGMNRVDKAGIRKKPTNTQLKALSKVIHKILTEDDSNHDEVATLRKQLDEIHKKDITLALKPTKKITDKEFVSSLNKVLVREGLYYAFEDLYNFHISCKASQLTILAGPSGIGKTRLPLAYAKCINAIEDNGTLLFMPISPSYTEPVDVLGYYNTTKNQFIPSDTGLTDIILHAQNNPDSMHMVIFDEMNLSQIEYWFAPFMSILERPENDRYITLYSSKLNDDNYPNRIKIGNNILFVGTINLDETTKDMSDRLIDRAIVINLNKQKLNDYFKNYYKNHEDNSDISVCEDTATYFSMKNPIDINYIESLYEQEINFLDELHEQMQEVNSSKGVSFRNTKKIATYLKEAPENTTFSRELAFDLIFKQTILKKINGYDPSVIKMLGRISEDGRIVDGILIDLFDKHYEVSNFAESKKEIKKKIKEYENYGFTR